MACLSDVKVCLLDESRNVVFEKKLISIAFKDESVIAKSIEFFGDPSPCMIHRSAVMKRLYMEFFEYFEKCGDIQNAIWEDVPEHLRDYLDMEVVNVKYIVLK